MGYIYIRFSFYNAKTGNISLFYNKDNEALTTPEKYYFKIIMNYNLNSWRLATGIIFKAYQIIPVDNSNYIEKIQNTLTKQDNLQQDYPIGVHNYATNKYDAD